jgi:hypothetical protein
MSEEFKEGWNDCDRGRSRTRNPYPPDQVSWTEWRLGWEARFYGEAL